MASQSLIGLILVAVSVFTPALLPLSALPVASASTNRLIKASTPAVYYVAQDNKRYVFPNQRVYESWYTDFNSVQTVSDAELASYPIGGNVFYRPSTRLVKITSDPKVYAVGPAGALHPIADEAAAIRLYGTNWSQRVDDLSDAFFGNYRVGGLLDGTVHPIDTFFRYTENTSYYILDYQDDTYVARQISDTFIHAYNLQKPQALMLRSADFPYNLGASIGDADASRFTTVRFDSPTSPTPSTPTIPTEPGEPGTPTGVSSTLSFSRWNALPATTKLVENDDAARLFAFTVDGDATQPLTISRVSLRLYIDAGGSNDDFSPGSDSDDPIAWSISQILNGFALRDLETKQLYDTETAVDGSGMVHFTVSIPVAAKAKKHIELTARVQTVAPTVRISADLIPAEDILLQSGSPTTTIKPATAINGGVDPSTTVTVVEYGALLIGSSSSVGDSVQPLNASLQPYSLTFTSTGEPFTISSLTFGFTVDGDDIYAIDTLSLTYTREDGVQETVAQTFVDTEENVFRFINLRLFVPKSGTITVPVTLVPKNDPTLYSGSRVQLKFLPEDFSATSAYSEAEYTNDNFGDANRLQNKTTNSGLLVFRQGTVVVTGHPDTPTGTINRYRTLPVLTFNITAKDKPMSIHRLTFKIETNDLDEDGDDNDYFERVADRIANTTIALANHHEDLDERAFIHPAVTYKFFDASAGQFVEDARGLQTALGDYAVFVLDFGSSPLSIAAGTTQAYDFDLDTTLFTPEEGMHVRVRVLGDTKGTADSQANFVWSDGSNIKTSGYLVSGLDLQGGYISVR